MFNRSRSRWHPAQSSKNIGPRGSRSKLNSVLSEAVETLIPSKNARDGPLPLLLVMMTIVTGLVDAFSFLELGHVFVANMTGNIVFVAFALAGAPGFSLQTSLSALAAFLVGAFGAGALGNRLVHERGRLLGISAGVQALFLSLATIMAFASGGRMSDFFLYGPIAALGVAMGIQNAAARKLAVPDLTTTVLTLTVTGMAADNRTAGGAGSRAGRRLLSVGAMFAGAAVGATLILKALPGYALFLALVVIVVVAFAVAYASRHDPPWTQPQ